MVEGGEYVIPNSFLSTSFIASVTVKWTSPTSFPKDLSYIPAIFTIGTPSPSFWPRIVQPKLCQSMMTLIPLSRLINHATRNVGIEGGFWRSMYEAVWGTV